MDDGVAASDNLHDGVEVTQLGGHDLLVGCGFAHVGTVRQPERGGERRQAFAQDPAEVAGGAGDQQSIESGHGR